MNVEAPFAHARLAPGARGAELAHQPPFTIGKLRVEPAFRSLAVPSGEAITIQPLAMRVLIALAEAQGEPCSLDDLITECWDSRIVGDDAIHRVISTLRRDLASLTRGAVGIETIAKVGYRLQLEHDDAGAELTAAANSPRFEKAAKPWLVAGLAVAAGAVAVGLHATASPAADITAIAVAADAAGRDAEAARFVGGLTGDLARLASAMPSVAFVEPGGQEARETLVLRVAVDARTAMPTARVRLVDTRSNAVVWSREFVAEGGTVVQLRELVANGISGVVQCGLDRSAVFHDPVGLRLFLGACEGLETGDLTRARAFAQQITRFRPGSPAGWACLANTTIFVAAQSGKVTGQVLASAQQHAQRALKADATSGLAYVALAMASRWKREPALDILERGIRVDPDFAMLHKHYAWALADSGMVSAAVDPAMRAVALHPHDPEAYRTAMATLANAGRIDEALSLSEKTKRLWRFDRNVELQRLELLFYEPDAKAALASFDTSPMRHESAAVRLREALVWRIDPKAYDWSNFDRMAQRMYAEAPDMAWRLSAKAAQMGDPDRALEWLARAPADSFSGWAATFAPEGLAVRRDPRFFAKMASVGMVARWQKSGRWPEFCADRGLGYDCRASARALALNVAKKGEGGGRTRART